MSPSQVLILSDTVSSNEGVVEERFKGRFKGEAVGQTEGEQSSSSEPSPQSLKWSQASEALMQWPLRQRNWCSR